MDGDLQDDPDEIFHEAQLAMTDFLQEIQFRRALQGELEKTLSGIENVRNERVHLVMPESSLFVDERLRRIRPPASQAQSSGQSAMTMSGSHTLEQSPPSGTYNARGRSALPAQEALPSGRMLDVIG